MIVPAGALLCLVASLIPLLPVARGIVRVFDFPRMQILVLSVAGLAASVALFGTTIPGIWSAAGYMSASAIQLAHIVRFTPLWIRTVVSFDPERSRGERIRILVCNVKQSNRNYPDLIEQVRRHGPDIAVFMETDEPWARALNDLAPDYEETVACPQDNSYGMVMYSRLPLTEQSIEFLLSPEVPSIDCTVVLGDRHFRLFCVHPEPPVPSRDTIGRDAEIAMVGLRVRDETRPVIVTGDLNDVAWSRTTRRFLRVAGLLDPREGRGPYNSFDARYLFLRWPLDHIFHSSHFQVIAMRRLPFVGSDHFPMLYDLALIEAAGEKNGDPEPADRRDLEEAEELVSTEQKRDRKPIGEDWENG